MGRLVRVIRLDIALDQFGTPEVIILDPETRLCPRKRVSKATYAMMPTKHQYNKQLDPGNDKPG